MIQILNFLKHFLRCNSRLYSFGEMPTRICISRQKSILIKVKINMHRVHELNFNPILFHLKVVPYGQTKIQNLCKRKEQNPYKFHFCNKRKYIHLDFKISKKILEYLWGSWEACCNIPSVLKYNLTRHTVGYSALTWINKYRKNCECCPGPSLIVNH